MSLDKGGNMQLKLKKDGKMVGLISANQMTYWFSEDGQDEL